MAEAKKTVDGKQSTVNSKKKKDSNKQSVVDNANEKPVEINEELSTVGGKLSTSKPEASTAKAGKRSAKATKEAEAKQVKEERKAQSVKGEAEEKPKVTQKPPRSRLERRSKKFRELAKLIDPNKEYKLSEAVELATKTSPVKFDATVELHIKLAVDPKQADQNIRDSLVLPSGSGKTVRISVFADVDDAAKAKQAGADFVGNEDLLAKLEKGVIDFDILIATPSMMAKLGKYARVLGPKGLMPNPKSGTVTTDVSKAVKEAKAGRVEYRVDSTGIVHLGIGKVSFGTDKLLKNAQAVFTSIKSAKPASVKGNYMGSMYITTSMGPSIRVLTNES